MALLLFDEDGADESIPEGLGELGQEMTGAGTTKAPSGFTLCAGGLDIQRFDQLAFTDSWGGGCGSRAHRSLVKTVQQHEA